MSSLLYSPRWTCRQCVGTKKIAQQCRTLRVRPTARPRQTEAAKLAPTEAETITLTDGTTIRVQADRPQRGDVGSDVANAPPPPPISASSTPPLPPPPPQDTTTLTPSPPSARPKPQKFPSTPPKSPHDYNWYYETLPPSPAHKTHATTFFTTHGAHATLLRSIAHFRRLPATNVPEVAFIGRSNVGKSSLLNAVMGCDIKHLLARTSATPGFTKTMNLYGIGPEGVRIKTDLLPGSGDAGRETIVGPRGLTIVDMPGYGSGSLSAWGTEILKYLQSRKALRRVFVLLDAEHGVKDKDRSILASLRLAGVSHQVILSKMDKLYIPPAKEIKKVGKGNKLKAKGTVVGLREKMKSLIPEIKPPVGGGALGEVLACSSEVTVDGKRLGIEDVRYAVLKAVGLEGEERKGFTESKKDKKKRLAMQGAGD